MPQGAYVADPYVMSSLPGSKSCLPSFASPVPSWGSQGVLSSAGRSLYMGACSPVAHPVPLWPVQLSI